MYLESEKQLWHVSLDMFFTSNSQNPKTGTFAYIFFSLSTLKHLPLTKPIALPQAAFGLAKQE